MDAVSLPIDEWPRAPFLLVFLSHGACYAAGMAFPPVTLWSTATHSCVLRRSDGQMEVLLCHDGRTIRLHTCDGESTAPTRL